MEKVKAVTSIKIGENIKFSYRKDPSLQLNGYVVKVLENTVIVDITEMLQQIGKVNEIEDRQVVKNGVYQKISARKKYL